MLVTECSCVVCVNSDVIMFVFFRQPKLNMPNPYLSSHCDTAQVIMCIEIVVEIFIIVRIDIVKYDE